MLGNLLDNACKWAKSRVRRRPTLADASVVHHVDDDGPGLDPRCASRCCSAACAPTRAPGSGLGLAIVRDLAELYGGSVALERSLQGGVRARLILPAQS